MDEIGTIPCPDCRSELHTFGLLNAKQKCLTFFAHCETCRKSGNGSRVQATVLIPFHIYNEAKWDNLIWFIP